MMRKLTAAQERALEKLNTDGVLFARNGVSVMTAWALANAGHGTMKTRMVDWTGPCGGRDRYLDWSLTK